jgi:glucose/arabinose dehydrogenase
VLVTSRDTAEILRVAPDGAADVVTRVEAAAPAGEGGLLGLALGPGGEELFVYVTTADDNRVLALPWDGETLGEPRVVLDGIPKASYHDGGGVVLGPDDLLYVSTGDAGDPTTAQDPDSLAGKILRITPDGEPAPGNPFDTFVYSLGHRNVQGLAFDDHGRLWASELGQDTWDELNLIEAGADYGWPDVEGEGGEADGFVYPVQVWSTAEASPSGLGYWDGSLWMAGLRGQTLWEIPLLDGEAGEPIAHLQGELGRLRAVVPIDDALLVTTSNTDSDDPGPDDDRLLLLGR